MFCKLSKTFYNPVHSDTLMKELIAESFKEIFPDRELPNVKVRFSGHFNQFNANVRYNPFRTVLEFHLSRSWRDVSPEIAKGLVQSLLVKVYKVKKSTINIELYENFVKNLHISIPKTLSDPLLDESFNRVNEKYFAGFVEKPNFVWGSASRATLGTYDYKTDTVRISSVLRVAPQHLLDYVVYHELLHKKLKFHSTGGRSFHHTSNFREMEHSFENFSKVESDLKSYLRVCKRRSIKRGTILDWFLR